MGMSAVKNLEPSAVFHYFEELNNIPRGSGNEKAVSDYLVSFAKEHNLEVTQDQALNVLIRKPGSKGYENSPCVVIQGHMDMVCEKLPDSKHDFEKDPIEMQVKGDMLYANGTTLGADDGIAVAMGLAVLAATDLAHPPVELLVTTSEETGMDGAHALDPKLVTGRTLINIDSEEEGILTVGCAGGCSAHVNLPVERKPLDAGRAVFAVTVTGLKGGHSGAEIHKGLANATKLLARLLDRLNGELDLQLCSVKGGTKHNAIPREAQAVVAIRKEDEGKLREIAASYGEIFRDEFKVADPDVHVVLSAPEAMPKTVMSKESGCNVMHFLYLIPNGVQSMSMDIKGLVESSLNLGVVQTKEDSVEAISSVRSAVGSIKENIFNTIVSIATLTGGKVVRESAYPEWRYNPESKIRTVFVELYKKLYGKEPVVTAIHAGLECALFDEKFNGEMDMISVGPTMVGVHTAEEHLSISSTQRTWDYLTEVLKSLH